MSILSWQSLILRGTNLINPFYNDKKLSHGMTYGCGSHGYDVRIAESFELGPRSHRLASTIERFNMPTDLRAVVHDKSTWRRQGISVGNTVLEAGWAGHLTLEINNFGDNVIEFITGMPIAQIAFETLDYPTERPYVGKYQNAKPGPQRAIFER